MALSLPIPDYPIDIFTPDAVRNAREVDDALRETAPAVRLHDGTVMIARHEHVTKGLLDWQTFIRFAPVARSQFAQARNPADR